MDNMDNSAVTLPVYSKLAQIILGIVAFFFVLYIGQDIIIPLVFATLLAILMNPAVNWLCGKKVNHVVAIFLVLLTSIVTIGALAYFLGSQASLFGESFPQFKQKLDLLSNEIIHWISQTFHISKPKITTWINKTWADVMKNGTDVLAQTLGTISAMLIIIFLLPVYIFMILFYKPLLLGFISQLFEKKKHKLVAEVLVETKGLIQSYLLGLLVEALLVAILNSAALLILGVQYAILIGIIGALLNIIPYIGGIIATALPMIIALATQTPVTAIWVLVAYLVVQFIDNNFLVPKIVASKVKINALVSIVVVLVGGALWGVPGMFLSIPLTAIAKVIFDRIEPLKPFGFLLGDNQPEFGKVIFNFKAPAKTKKTVSET